MDYNEKKKVEELLKAVINGLITPEEAAKELKEIKLKEYERLDKK